MTPVVVVFARVPRLGVGKRRLARRIGDRAALRFARGELARLLAELRLLRGFERIVALTPDHHARFAMRGFGRIGPKRIGQGRGDLGARMGRVFRHYRRRPVIIIGSDIPGIAREDLRRAAHALRGAQAVFGPAVDGGYWLIGVSGRRPADPFGGVRWSSEDTLADTLRNFRHHRVAMLRTLADADTAIPSPARFGTRA
ncbi:TIGR04282 family arsenosugar biosynthesis glycosyltransferase [Acidiphilium sp. C61]|jgi:rSAM/selenodomain-associated transferase 1|uniref:TIGR04282 family arsenosugar biosynthesis glycosyltransferase n=1 Tax=Acidiphilium sp. C61 TaxID=1671485 RepID=UPI00157AC1A4|nr:TIGR04282 family arsenosugar biosynthesis glycosyltransferase [Acidiphilium sp. C61]